MDRCENGGGKRGLRVVEDVVEGGLGASDAVGDKEGLRDLVFTETHSE